VHRKPLSGALQVPLNAELMLRSTEGKKVWRGFETGTVTKTHVT